LRALLFRGYTYKLVKGECHIRLQKGQDNEELLNNQPHFCPRKIPKHIPPQTIHKHTKEKMIG